ncbi:MULTISPECIES: hypothetical protein [unclassified Leucobacter]|uniref:hypothetical protein n=1 Tax=unclassified Leucobacter TaxID=2621730 RepID=UPI000621F8A4|nr:hypothetical protein [Leucobacter sp. Ag1]KKI18703.1 hypothetical protein XM48_10490 [Leucobacter sp. Ag1]
MDQKDKAAGLIRTFTPALVGVLLARLIAAVPTVAAAIAWLDGIFAEAGMVGVSVLVIVQSVVTAGVITLYYWLVRRFGDRWPKLEWLLGSPRTPSYAPGPGTRRERRLAAHE